MKFDDNVKKESEQGSWFEFGTYKVQIGAIDLGQTEAGKEYVEVTVLDPTRPDVSDSARVWFTTDKAANYSFNVLRSIYVHNAPEAKKDAAHATIDAVVDTKELVDKLNEKLIGKECWFSKYPSPDRTYTNQAGEVKPSIDKNIYGYEPKPRPDLLATIKQVMPGATEVPFASEGDAPGSTVDATVPKGSGW